MTPARVDRLIGVYNADGSLSGELRYVVGRWRGTHHCELCDITHGFLTKKRSFRAVCEGISVPFELVHLDERSPEVAATTEGHAPCVLASVDCDLVIILDTERLRACSGDVDAFSRELRAALARHALSLPA